MLDRIDDATVEALCRTVERFGRERLDARRLDREHKLDPELLAALADLGLFGLSIPPEYGGFGVSLRGICDVVATLARYDRSVATAVGLHLGLGTRPLVAFGAEPLKQRLLPELATGARIAAFATTEPDAGSDLSAIRTRASEEAGRLRVNGSKIFVTNGGLAGCITITASTPGLGGARRGHSLLVLFPDDPGVRVGAEEDKLGLRASSTTSLHLDDALVPMDRIVGEPGQGMAALHHVLAWGRTVMAAGCIGTATAALHAAVGHVATRWQFGRPLLALDVVREQIAELAALRFAMEAMVHATAELEDDPGALGHRSLAAKVFCSEASWEAADLAVQLHGGSGFIEETGVALLLRDARITRIFEGANDVLRVRLGMMTMVERGRRPSLDIREPGLQSLVRATEGLADTVSTVTDDLAKRFGVRVGGEQSQLWRLGALATLSAASDATVRAAARANTPEAIDLATQWVAVARRRSYALLDASVPRDVIGRIVSTLEGGP